MPSVGIVSAYVCVVVGAGCRASERAERAVGKGIRGAGSEDVRRLGFSVGVGATASHCVGSRVAVGVQLVVGCEVDDDESTSLKVGAVPRQGGG